MKSTPFIFRYDRYPSGGLRSSDFPGSDCDPHSHPLEKVRGIIQWWIQDYKSIGLKYRNGKNKQSLLSKRMVLGDDKYASNLF